MLLVERGTVCVVIENPAKLAVTTGKGDNFLKYLLLAELVRINSGVDTRDA